MDKPQFVYVIYMMTTPETLWNALMDGEMTKQYWVTRQGMCPTGRSARPGSHQDYDDPTMVKIVGKVGGCLGSSR